MRRPKMQMMVALCAALVMIFSTVPAAATVQASKCLNNQFAGQTIHVCLAVNDAFVMGAWGRDQKSTGIVRMMADGNAAYSKALGLDADFSKFGMGTRSQRYSMLVEDGVVKQLNVEQGGAFEVSNAETMLKQLA